MDIEGLKTRLRAGRFALDEVAPLTAEAAAALEELEAKCNHIMSEHGKRLEEVARLQRELEEARKDAGRVACLEKALTFMLERFDQPGNTFSQRLACEKARNAMQQDAAHEK